MSIKYTVEFVIAGRSCGIEDRKEGRPQHRFCLWSGGCPVGQAEYFSDARAALYQRALGGALQRRNEALKALNELIESLADDTLLTVVDCHI